MKPGRHPKPTAVRRADGNPGNRGYNPDEPVIPPGMPECPPHLSETARIEWDRIIGDLHAAGIVTSVDRAVLAAYCQAWGRWVEAEEKLSESATLFKTPSGYIQQSPWLTVANKQLELMSRFMNELGITPSSRARVVANLGASEPANPPMVFRVLYEAKDGTYHDQKGNPVTDTDNAVLITGPDRDL